MTKMPSLLLIWLTAALGVVAMVAGFNVAVDPFGYFGTNRIGYYFSSERQFKYSIVKSYDYNAIILGDSRMAFTDPTYIALPEYRFVNGGIGGSSLAEQVALLEASRLHRLKLAVFGLQLGDLAQCTGGKAPRASTSPEDFAFDTVRYAASLTQLAYSIDAVKARSEGRGAEYHADGTRSVVSKVIDESPLDGKTERYWDKINGDVSQENKDEPSHEFGPACRELLVQARKLADRYGFDLLVVFVPRNSDLLDRMDWNTERAHQDSARFISQVQKVVPHVADLSMSKYSDSGNFWLDDSMHFKPMIGAAVVQEAIHRSFDVQVSR